MTRLTKNQRIIRYLVERCGSRLHRTRLVKALFLADYEGRRAFGAPLTSYTYWYKNHGPFTGEILDDIRALEEVGLLQERLQVGWTWPFYSYTAKGDAPEYQFTPRELLLLEAVADRCTAGRLDDLLKHVYSTPPMRAAQKNRPIPLSMVTRYGEPAAVTRETLQHAERELDQGQGEDFDRVLDELQAGLLPGR